VGGRADISHNKPHSGRYENVRGSVKSPTYERAVAGSQRSAMYLFRDPCKYDPLKAAPTADVVSVTMTLMANFLVFCSSCCFIFSASLIQVLKKPAYVQVVNQTKMHVERLESQDGEAISFSMLCYEMDFSPLLSQSAQAT
jgi:hypothetical protein